MITKNCVTETKVSSLKVWPSVFLRFGFSLLPLIQRLTLINCIFDHFFFYPPVSTLIHLTTMDALVFDPVTKNFSVNEAAIADWSKNDQEDYAFEVESLQVLSKQLVASTTDVPPPSNQINSNLSKQVEKMRETGLRESKAGKDLEAARLLSMALEMALKRPLWEASQYQMSQVAAILDSRCDVYIKLNKWAEAFADVQLLATLQPNEWSNFYRKARCLRRIEKYAEARACLTTAAELSKNNPAAAAKVKDEIEAISSFL